MMGRIAAALRRRYRCWRALAAARAVTRARLARGGIRRVLVVCYGNIYRSPYVGEYLRRHAAGAFEVRTAGFHSKVGRPSPSEHVEMCAARGVSLSAHRSTLADPALLAWADTILLMDRRNWLALDAAGVASDRLVWLGALDGGALEIPDPYGLPADDAARIVERLTRASEVFLEKLRA